MTIIHCFKQDKRVIGEDDVTGRQKTVYLVHCASYIFFGILTWIPQVKSYDKDKHCRRGKFLEKCVRPEMAIPFKIFELAVELAIAG